MTRKKSKKKWIVLPVVTAVLAVAVVVCFRTDVFGKFTPEAPYVEGESEPNAAMTVTYEGSNWKGEVGSGAKPSSSEVPTCEGPKGSETNPFVILEIVADHAHQQMPYLAMETGEQTPIDVMKIGLDIQKELEENGRAYSFVPTRAAHMTDEELKKLGQWFSKWQYSLYKIGGNGEKEERPFAEIAKLYSFEITTDELKENNIDPKEFNDQYNTGKFNKYSANDLIDMKSLIAKYPVLFEKDDDGEELRQEAKEDNNNWDVTGPERVVTKEAVSETYKGSGYIVAVAPGEGDFGFASEEDAKNWVFTKTGTSADRWKYVTDESELDPQSVENNRMGKAQMGDNWFFNTETGVEFSNNTGDLYTKYLDSDKITGMYLKLSQYGNLTVRYDIEPEEYKETYTFAYYGVRNNNVLKRQLFVFADQEEYDDFKVQVITMTPEELNALPDTDETVDLIERADMYYVGDYVSNEEEQRLKTNNIDNVFELYYRYVLGEETYDVSKIRSFNENDLDWNLCYKMLYRLCQNPNLPLVMTQALGLMVDDGTDSVEMYQSAQYPNVSRKGTLNNLAKLYIIGTQFDLTARMAEGDYKQTFADSLLDKMESIDLAQGGISDESTTPPSKTGYYERPKLIPVPTDQDGLISAEDKERQEKCYYLWNMLTFFPDDEELESIFMTPDQHITIEGDMLKKFVGEYGYMRSFFESAGGQTMKTFLSGDATHKDGSDGTTGNVAIPHNNGSYVYSTLLGNTESAVFFNNAMNATYLIMNNRPEVVNKQIVKVMKQKKEYVKLSDEAVLVDYVSDDTFGDETSYIKVHVDTNNNGQDGLLTALTLQDEDGNTAPKKADLKLYKDKACTEEYEKVTYGANTGYKIPTGDVLIGYIPYSLAQWAKGYNQIEATTVGRIYSLKRDVIIAGKPQKTVISVTERTLFNLE